MKNSENVQYYADSNRLIVLFLFFVLWSVLLHAQVVNWEDGKESITVSDGEKKFTSFIATSPEMVENMAHYNYAAPFSLDPNNEEGINAVLGQNGRVVVNMFSYDPTKEGSKGPLVYGIRSAEGESRSWPVVYTHSLFGDKNTSSTNIKRLSHNIEIFKTAAQNDCNFDVMFGSGGYHRMADIGLITAGALIDVVAAGSAIASLLAAPVTGGGSLAAIDSEVKALIFGTSLITGGIYELDALDGMQEECQNAYTPYQPIILEITIRNATFHSLRLPGHESLSKEMTAGELFENAIETSPDQYVINNDNLYAVFENDQDKVELTVNGDVLIFDHDDKDNLSKLIGTENFQLYVGAKDGAEGIVSEDFVIEDRGKYLLPDFVFNGDYDLRTLEELETYIKQNKHLPHVPNQEFVNENNYYSIPEMMFGQLQNLEEIYLDAVAQEEKINVNKSNSNDLKRRLEIIETTLQNLENDE